MLQINNSLHALTEAEHSPKEIMKSAMDFINFALNAKNNSTYNAAIDAIPTNDQATALPELEPLIIHSEAERREFRAKEDFAFISTQTEIWNRKWELEIGPLL